MSKHDDRVSIRQMLEYAQQARDMARERQRLDLDTDLMFRYALTHLMELIGEAATRVSTPTRQKLSEIPWADIVGMRNRLIHGYDRIDLNILWDTVTVDLPPLIEALEIIVGEFE